MASSEIDYSERIEAALRGMIRDLLAAAAEDGLPGAHHFLLTLRSDHPGVEMPPSLRRRYPRELTVVLQHQFWDLAVDETAFEVTLRFGGAPHRLRVPFESLTGFADPAAAFALRLGARRQQSPPRSSPPRRHREESGATEEDSGTVVSLDDFRRRDDPD